MNRNLFGAMLARTDQSDRDLKARIDAIGSGHKGVAKKCIVLQDTAEFASYESADSHSHTHENLELDLGSNSMPISPTAFLSPVSVMAPDLQGKDSTQTQI